MKQDARIITYGYWGENRPPISLALTGAQMMADAIKYGRVSGLTRYQDDGKVDNSKSKNDDPGSLPIGLSRSPVFPPDFNKKVNSSNVTVWTSLLGGTNYLEEFPNPFTGNIPGLGHISANTGAYQGVTIPENTGHTLRLYLLKAPETVTYPILTANWDGFQFQIADNDAVLQRLAPTWTQPNETQLITLLGIKTPTVGQQNQIETLQRSLYEDVTSLQLGDDGDKSGGRFYEIEFIPEQGGKVSVYSSGKLAGVLEHKPILKTREPGIIWGESPLIIRRNGGQFFWQAGYPQFGNGGTIRYPYYINYELDPLENFEFNKVSSEPADTFIVLSQDEENREIVVTFSTSNRRITPFLYLAQAYLDAGERSGSMEKSFDTNDHKDSKGNAPILKLSPMCEGELRRAQYNFQIDDMSGQTFQSMGFNYETLEHRVGDLEIGGKTQVKGGLVRAATSSDWGSALANQARSQVARPETTMQGEICDAWALLEECELEGGEIVGDGRYVGKILRRCLRIIGTPWSEMAGIPDGEGLNGGLPLSAAGKLLQKAAIGESWAVINSAGTLADFVYYLIERYGMGRILTRGADGIWYFQLRPNTTRVLNGHEVHFKSLASGHHHPDTYPGRYTMLQPIDLPNNVEDFFNYYKVRGAEGYNDEPLVRSYTIRESVARTGNSLKKIGRLKKMRTIEDSSLRTEDDVEWALQSAVELHGLPPRFLSFESYFHSGLFIGDRVKADFNKYMIRRISGGNWEDDTMQFLLQRVGY